MTQVALGCQQTHARLLFQDVQSLVKLASDQNSGYSSRCKVPQRTGYLKGPDAAALIFDFVIKIACSLSSGFNICDDEALGINFCTDANS